MTDLRRWSDAAHLSPNWADRARFAARLVPAGLRILDIGCGAMDVERLFAPSSYHPVDIVARDGRTTVVDLNRDIIPPSILTDIDIVTMLGVIEYIDDIDPHLRAIASKGVQLLVSYNSTDRCQNNDRRGDGWVNDFTTNDIIRKLEQSGFEVQKFAVYDQQVIIFAAPRQRTEQIIQEQKQKSDVSVDHSGRKSLVLAGFFGRGNCGDEAILQCLFEAFHETYDIIISVDEHGAYQGFWDWYPYTKARIIHQTNIGEFYANPAVAGILVGGGGLPVGFGANQVLAARYAGRKAAIAGVDLLAPLSTAVAAGQDAIRSYLSLFDFVSIRQEPAKRKAWSRPKLNHGGDWALRLPKDTAEDIHADRNRVLITLREYPIERVPWTYIQKVMSSFDVIKGRGFTPVLLPFCPEDERFLKELGLDQSVPIERHWWNPRRVKQIISSSGMVLSFGRLHPIIFAADVGVPVAAIKPLLASNEFGCGKIMAAAKELGIAFIDASEIATFLDAPRTADPAKVNASRIRTDQMVQSLRELLAG